jgi:hypothetical protein
MKIDLNLKGADTFRKWAQTWSSSKVLRIRKLVAMRALDIQRGAKEKLRANGSINTGNLRNNIIVEFEPGEFVAEVGTVETTAKYAPYVEFGTGPRGKFPPLDALRQWALKHGFDSPYPVAKKIKEKGTPAQPFLGPTADAILPFFDREVADILEKDEGSDSGSSKALI